MSRTIEPNIEPTDLPHRAKLIAESIGRVARAKSLKDSGRYDSIEIMDAKSLDRLLDDILPPRTCERSRVMNMEVAGVVWGMRRD